MKLSGNRLKMSDGSVRKFKSAAGRERFEKYVRALKHGFKPRNKK